MDKKIHYTRIVMRVCLSLGILVTIVGFLFKIQHWPWAYELLLAAYGLSTAFWLVALLELYKSKTLAGRSKYLWGGMIVAVVAIGYFFFFPLLYILLEWAYLDWSKSHIHSVVNQKVV